MTMTSDQVRGGSALSPGMRVLCRDAEWLIKRVDASNHAGTQQAIHCIGVDDLVRGHEAIFLTQLDRIQPIDPRETRLIADETSGYRRSKLLLEARLRQMPAAGTQPDFQGMGVFKPMRFQEETVERALQQVRPRLLLADAVGLGKTIQVGMVLTELIRRGRGDRILVLAKKSMLTQLQSELWNRFAIPLVRLDSQGIARLRLRIPSNRNPFEVYHRVIISLDTLKNVGHYRHFLEATRWDCVIIDEAHNVAGASVPNRHLSYRLARLLSTRTDSLLLTTATPHNGKRETFGRLIALLDPSAIPDPDYKEYSPENIGHFFFMRFKEDVREDAGSSLTDRILAPLEKTTASATDPEEAVYAILAELREKLASGTWANRSSRGQMLLSYGIYKQFLSSPESCSKTIDDRRERVKREDPLSPEIPWLDRLVEALKPLCLEKTARFALLREQLAEMGWDGGERCPRVLVFTEYRETQDALAEALGKAFGIKVSKKFEDQPQAVIATIHGSMPDTALMKTVENFGTGRSAMRMLIATDVASEGINLHHECHQIVHYDLPWSIITLVQRNGRIDRIGQRNNPVLRYLLIRTAQGSLRGDETIFERLIQKVEEVNRSTRQGESVLKLYDPEAEERYFARHGVLGGDLQVLEKQASEASREAQELEELLRQAAAAYTTLSRSDTGIAEAAVPSSPDIGAPAAVARPIRVHDAAVRTLPEVDYFKQAYAFLSDQAPEAHPPLEKADPLLGLVPPPDLRRRLGGPGGESDVIFGATSIPEEAWPEDDRFYFTPSVQRVEDAITAARRLAGAQKRDGSTVGYWSREHLLVNHHPVMLWLTERLLMGLPRGACPLVASRALPDGDLCFCFIGQVSTQSGAPLVVNAHAALFRPGGRSEILPLETALERAGFAGLVNDGTPARIVAAQALVPAAAELSVQHLKSLEAERTRLLRPLIVQEERRLRGWKNRRLELLEARIEALGEGHPRAQGYRREIDHMERYHEERQTSWKQSLFTVAAEPSTQLVLAIEGRS